MSLPIGREELGPLFATVTAGDAPLALAVSGGSDSTALVVLLADFLRSAGGDPARHTVLCVDHRLRSESAAEAAAVMRQAAALGFQHAVLAWDEPKPASGLQAAARAARYRLLAEYALPRGITTLLTAHTADDQAETLLMRLARGSGLDGLAAMARRTDIVVPTAGGNARMTLVRPLLDVPKARLRATLTARGIAWSEDPSNAQPAFERVRLRAAAGTLEGIGLTTESLALSARRLRRAREALQAWADRFGSPGTGAVHADPCGFLRIDGALLRALPLEVIVRVLARAVAQAGGSAEPVPLARLEAIAEAVCGGTSGAWTLARAKITATAQAILLEREPGRAGLPTVALEPGTQGCWDGRFLVRAGGALGLRVEVGPLGADGLRELRQVMAVRGDAPAGALQTSPAFRHGGTLLAAPGLAFWAEERLRGLLGADFVGAGADDQAWTQEGPEVP